MRRGGGLIAATVAALVLGGCSSGGGFGVSGASPSSFLTTQIGTQRVFQVTESGQATRTETRSVLSVTPEVAYFQVDVRVSAAGVTSDDTYELHPDGSYVESLKSEVGGGRAFQLSGELHVPSPSGCQPGATTGGPITVTENLPGESETFSGSYSLRCGDEQDVSVPAGHYRARVVHVDIAYGPPGRQVDEQEDIDVVAGVGMVREQVVATSPTVRRTETLELVKVVAPA